MFDKHTNKQKEKDGVWQNIEIWEDGLSIDEGPKQFVVERGDKFEGGFKSSLHFMYTYIYIYMCVYTKDILYICIYVKAFIYIYILVNIYIYIYIYIY